MWRVGLIAVLAALCAAAPARAGTVNLWACHGPDGAPLSESAFVDTVFSRDSEVTHACTIAGDARRAHFLIANPQGIEQASMRLDVPAGLAPTEVRIDRAAKGPGYFASGADGAAFESAGSGTTLTAPLDAVTNSSYVRIGVSCDAPLGQQCAGDDAYVDVRSVEVTAVDASAPHGVVGSFRSPWSGEAHLDVAATDVGAGLESATAIVDGQAVSTVPFAGCAKLAANDLAIDRLCPANGHVTLPVDTTALSDGDHRLVVVVRDAAGNVATAADLPWYTENGVATPTPTPTPTPTVAATASPTPAPTAAVKPAATVEHCALTLPKRLTPNRRVTVRCPASAPAPATLRLTAPGRTLATSGTVAPGRSGALRLKLTASARSALRRHGKLKATLALYEGGTKRSAVAVTLRTR